MEFLTTSKTGHFQTDHLQPDLKGRSVRGGALTLTGQAIKFILQIGSTAVLARLLTPGDFGVVAMVTVVTGFIMLFKDLGLSMATVQREEISHAQVSTLFWVNVVASGAIMAVTAAMAPLVAWFYGEPRLTNITLALASGMLFGGLAVQHQALLSRQMRFGVLVVLDVGAQFTGIVVALLAAWRGLGYWSLVLMQLASAAVTAVGVWVACSWRPGRPVRGAGVRELLSFGGHMTSFSVINYFARNLDNILIGRYWGAGPLGFYSRAYSLLMLPIGQIVAPISGVANPTLSRLQDDPERYRNYYLKAVSVIAYVSMPLVVILGVFSREVITLLMGNQWLEAAEIFQILAFAAFWQPVCSTVGWVYVSLNRTRKMAKWGFMACPLIMISFCIGLPWGARGVAASYVVVMWLLVYPLFHYALKGTPVTMGAVFQTLQRPVLLSIMIGACLQLTYIALKGQTDISIVVASGGCGLLTILFMSRIWKGLREDILSIVHLGKSVFNTNS